MRDLRLSDPFPELQDYVNSIDMDSLELNIHGHIPWAVVLIKASQAWRKDHDDKLPSNFAEKKAFKEFIKTQAMDFSKEINFEEAITNASLLFESKDLPDNVQDIFKSSRIENVDGSNKFWVAAKVIKQFHEAHKRLPVAGSVPDMTSTTDHYLTIQRVYHDKGQ